jgi:hypothetical protein
MNSSIFRESVLKKRIAMNGLIKVIGEGKINSGEVRRGQISSTTPPDWGKSLAKKAS